MHDQLLAQADLLASHDPTRPTQANLRRAVSAAYDAMFHFLTAEAARRFIPQNQAPLQHLMTRGFQHGEMKSAAKAFTHEQLPAAIARTLGSPIPPELRSFAKTFVQAQERRHVADYDLREQFDRQSVQAFVQQVRMALSKWEAVRTTDAASLFLLCLLMWDRLKKR